MAELQKLAFTKVWTNPTDFPTYQPNEEQVRKDLQLLHDETRDYLNDVLLQTVSNALDETVEEVREMGEAAIVGAIPDGSVGTDKLADYLKRPLVPELTEV